MNNDFFKMIPLILSADVRSLENPHLFNTFYHQVSSERQADIDRCSSAEDKMLSLAGGILLDHLLKRMDIHGEIVHKDNGKPVVKDQPGVFVSLTHSFPYAAAMIGGRPCGLDLEDRGLDLENIARRYYNPAEKDWAGTDPAKITDIWCRKECFIKYDKPQEVRYLDTFSIPEDYRYLSLPLEGFSFEVLLPKGSYAYETIDLNYLTS